LCRPDRSLTLGLFFGEVAQIRFLCRYPHTSTHIRTHPIALRSDVIGLTACGHGRSGLAGQSLHTHLIW